MAQTTETIAFKITINAGDASKSISAIQKDIRALQKELNDSEIGSPKYKALEEQIGKAKSRLTELKNEQKLAFKEAAAQAFPTGSYRELEARLQAIREKQKLLGADARDGELGKALKKEADDVSQSLNKIKTDLGITADAAGRFDSLISRVFGKKFGTLLRGASSELGGFGQSFQSFAGGAAAFVAVGAAAVAAISSLNNFAKEYQDTAETVQKYSSATGDALEKQSQEVLATSKTFSVSTEQIADAAQQLALSSGTSFTDALARIQAGLVEGQKDNEEYLKGIAEFPSKFKDAGDATSEYSKKKQQDLERTRELTKAQAEFAKKFAPIQEAFKSAATVATTYFTKALSVVIDYLTWTSDKLSATADFVVGLGQSITDFFGITSEAERQAYEADLQRQEQFNSERLSLQKKYTQELTKVYGKDFVDGLTEQQTLSFELAFVGAQNAALAGGKDTGTAFAEGLKSGVELLGKSGVDLTTLAQKQAAAAQQKVTEEAKKAAEERAADRKKEAEKAAADRKKEEERILKEEVQRRNESAALLLSLERDILNARSSLIKDAFQRESEQSRLAYQQDKEDRAQQQAEQIQQLKAQQEEFAKIIGEKDARTIAREEQTQKQIIQITQQYAALEAAKAQEQADAQVQIEKDKQAQILQERQDAAEKTLEITRQINASIIELEELNNQEYILGLKKRGVTEAEIITKDAALQLDLLRKQLDQINQLEAQAALLGVEADRETATQRTIERKKLTNAILQAELDLADKTEKAQKDAVEKEKATLKQRDENWASITEKIGSYALQGLNVINDAARQIDEQEQKRLEREAERSSKRVEQLRSELDGASALRTDYLNRQIEAELEAQKRIDAEREALETERKRKAKAAAIIEATINTAVGVTRAFATQGLGAAIAVGIAGAAQIALIAAKEFEGGGLVTQDASGIYVAKSGAGALKGKVQPNVSNPGKKDNVVIAVNDEEAIINKTQQRIIGFDRLRAAGVPGFETGGLVTKSYMPAPVFSSENTTRANGGTLQGVDINALAKIFNDMVDAKIQKINVSLSTKKLDAVTQDQEQIKKAIKLQ